MNMVTKVEVEGGELIGRWCVVVSKPGMERTAVFQLTRQQFEVYMPLAASAQDPTPRNPEGKPVIRPFFPRYIFVRLNDVTINWWRSMYGTIGVSSVFVGPDSKPLAVPERIINTLRAREENGLIKVGLADEAEHRWQKGDAVRYETQKGDLDAVFVQAVDKTRAEILFNLLGRETSKVVTLLSLK